MIDMYISFDNEDEILGNYFNKCKEDVKLFLEQSDIQNNLTLIHSRLCTSAYLETILINLENPYFFLAYNHGNNLSIRGKHGQFIEVDLNTNLFSACLFYTNACLCGTTLADQLIDSGAHTFIGYTTEVYALKEEYEEVSIKCDNSGLIAFLSEDISAAEAINRMKNYYTYQIEKIFNSGDPLRAGLLTSARESLVIKGNSEIRLSDMTYALNK